MKNQPLRQGLLHPENYLEPETNDSSQKCKVARIINCIACGRSKVLFDKEEETPVYGMPTMPWMPLRVIIYLDNTISYQLCNLGQVA